MQKFFSWVLAATLVCGASVLTACSSNEDNPVQPELKTNIDETKFPDDNFRNYLLEQDYGKDGVLTEAEIRNITVMDVSEKDIKSLKGIEYFTALDSLDCSVNELTTLDVSKNTALKKLNCGFNELTTLDVSKNTALTNLNCRSNKLTALDVSKNTALNVLTCCGNQISGQNMDDLISGLPQHDTSDPNFFGVYDNSKGDEGNVCTKSQVAAAKAKGWMPKYLHEYEYEEDGEIEVGVEWLEYEGSE